jgi:hypothetical protein
MAGGSAVSIPQLGEHFSNGIYVARCIVGYGDTAGSAGGASDGLDLWTDTQETIALFDINATDIVVHQVTRDVETAFTASVTVSVGDGANASGFIASADFAATLASSGLVLNDTSALAYGYGKWYKSTDTIDAVVGGADVATGVAHIFLVYSHAGSLPQNDTGGSSNT